MIQKEKKKKKKKLGTKDRLRALYFPLA